MTARDQGTNEGGTGGHRTADNGGSEDPAFKDYDALERRYDGPIPADALDRLRFGSALMAEIVRTEDSIAFYRAEIVSMRKSARGWYERGNLDMARRNIADSRLYLRQWRRLRRHLENLRAEIRARDRSRAERAQLLNAKRVLDLIGEAAD